MNAPLVYLNGEFLHESEARISINDRGFLYGDGIFETLRVYRGVPFAWDAHWLRLESGARLIGLRPIPSSRVLREAAAALVERNARPESVLRLHVSRGAGPRGYSPKGAHRPTCLLTLHPLPPPNQEAPHRVRLVTSAWRVPATQQLATCKSASRMLHVLARAEADAAGADDAVLLNLRQEVAETSGANFFWIERDIVWTTPLGSGALDGVTRRLVIQLCRTAKISAGERPLTETQLRRVHAAFVTSSVSEVAEVSHIDRHRLECHPLVAQIQKDYAAAVQAECP